MELTDEQKISPLDPDDVFSVMQDILLREEKIGQDREHFWMIGLASNNWILFFVFLLSGWMIIYHFFFGQGSIFTKPLAVPIIFLNVATAMAGVQGPAIIPCRIKSMGPFNWNCN